MQRIDMKKKIKNHFMHAIVLALLIAISVYSIYSVISSQWDQDTTTLTAVEIADNVLPFVDYLTIGYEFRNSTVFQETWNYSRADLMRLLPDVDSVNGRWNPTQRLLRRKDHVGAFLVKYSTHEDLLLDNVIDVAMITGLIKRIDTKYLRSITQDSVLIQQNEYNDRSSLNKTAKISDRLQGDAIEIIDNCLKATNFAAIVEKVISRIVSSGFVRLFSRDILDVTELPFSVAIDYLDVNKFHISIPLQFLGKNQTKDFLIGVLPSNDAPNPPLFASITYRLFSSAGYEFNGVSGTHNSLSNPFVSMRIELENSGIYNSSDVHSESYCRVCKGQRWIEQCKMKCLLDSLIDRCQCLPFTYRRLYEPDSNLSYCTAQKYETCLNQKNLHPGSCSSKVTVPCVAQNSKHTVNAIGYGVASDMATGKGPDSAYHIVKQTDQKYRIYVRLLFTQTIYVVFRERFQQGWMETLGQIGGNLGVFLSFSLYGVWQVGIFTYFVCMRHLGTRPQSGSVLGITTQWLRMAQWSREEEDRDSNNRDIEQELEDILKRAKQIDSDCGAIRDELRTG